MEEATTSLHLTEISERLAQRAATINQTLQQSYRYIQVQSGIDELNRLHVRHVDTLTRDDLVGAHTILPQIHALSFALERDEFWARHWIEQPGIRPRLSPDAFRNGPIVKMYMDTPFAHLGDSEARRMRPERIVWEEIEAVYMAAVQ